VITAVVAAVVAAAAVAVAAAAVAQIAVAAAAAEIFAAASVPPSRQATACGQVLRSPPPVTSVAGQWRQGPAVAVGAASAVSHWTCRRVGPDWVEQKAEEPVPELEPEPEQSSEQTLWALMMVVQSVVSADLCACVDQRGWARRRS
jgi:hypothetical protein